MNPYRAPFTRCNAVVEVWVQQECGGEYWKAHKCTCVCECEHRHDGEHQDGEFQWDSGITEMFLPGNIWTLKIRE